MNMVSIVIYFSYFYLWVMLSNFLKFFLTIVPYAGREYLSSVFGRKYQMIPTGVNTICLFFEFHTLSVTQRLRRRNPPTSLRWLHPPRRDLDSGSNILLLRLALSRLNAAGEYRSGRRLRPGMTIKGQARW